jgi:hypothetical protein
MSESARQVESLSSRSLFIALNVLTMGLYALWFNYKLWRFVGQRQQRPVQAVVRALLSIFFFNRLAGALSEIDARPDPQQGRMTALFIGANLLSLLPDPWWWLSFLALIPLLRLHARAVELTWEDGRSAFYVGSFGWRHALLVLFGLVLWYAWWLSLIAPAYPY